MRDMVVPQVTASENRVDQLDAVLRAITHCNGRRAIQLDDGRWVGAQQQVVENDDLRPVGVVRRRSLRVHRGDRGLQRVWSESARRERALDQSSALGDQTLIPA